MISVTIDTSCLPFWKLCKWSSTVFYPFTSSSIDSISWAWFCLAAPLPCTLKSSSINQNLRPFTVSVTVTYCCVTNHPKTYLILNGTTAHHIILRVSQMTKLDGNSLSILHMASVDWWYSLPRWLTNIAGQLMLASSWELARGSQSRDLSSSPHGCSGFLSAWWLDSRTSFCFFFLL